MTGRRPFLAGLVLAPGALMAAPLTAAIPESGRLTFRVLRNDSDIGTHTLAFTMEGEAVRVEIAIELAVRVLGIPLFRYSHRNTERWTGERLLLIDSSTDRNGRSYRVQARASGEGITVEGTEGGRYVAPGDAASTSYWHARFLRTQKIDTQGGRLLGTTIEDLGEEMIPIGGRSAAARRFRVSGDLTLDIWYDRAGAWSGLLFAGEDGSTIRYVRT
jgi:hypothetical protein